MSTGAKFHSLQLNSTMKVSEAANPGVKQPEAVLVALMVAISAQCVLLQLEWKVGVTDHSVNVPLLPVFYSDNTLHTIVEDTVIPMTSAVLKSRETSSLPMVVHTIHIHCQEVYQSYHG